ncbi:annulin-like [Cimex lectularius]|uniref:Transglutaminase-like domain-containing protein n=1 Tax=Cimex lectularius TaxID=79782 RepID=A0A8I6RMT3_CIMLE|nr:annulin-like [Cimex lectularius]
MRPIKSPKPSKSFSPTHFESIAPTLGGSIPGTSLLPNASISGMQPRNDLFQKSYSHFSSRTTPSTVLFLSKPSPLEPETTKTVKKKFLDKTGLCPAGKYNRDVPSESNLIVLSLGLEIGHNGQEHNTSVYHDMIKSEPELIVRRGHPFRILLNFSRKYSKKMDEIIIHFKNLHNKTHSHVLVSKRKLSLEIGPGIWEAAFEYFSLTKPIAYVKIIAPPDCPIGFWSLEIETAGCERRFVQNGRIAILFNPWSPLDVTYMKEEKAREQLVMKNVGKIFQGCSNSMNQRSWKFNQFEEGILDNIITILGKYSQVDSLNWGSPVDVARGIANMVRGPDGIIETNFSNNYEGGKPPNEWEGSAEIIKKFIATNQPVKYGHCYTLTAVMITAFRALGIPARPVTGFELPVTPDDKLFADLFITEDGLLAQDVSHQRLWHYTSWAEAWMARSDLGSAYGGWQATYSTIGPAPVEAIKSGELQIPYDTKVFYCAINSFYCIWKFFSQYERLKLISKERNNVGAYIMTPDVLPGETENIVSSYKSLDSAIEEPPRLNKRFNNYIENEAFSDVKFKCKAPNAIYFGQHFMISLSLVNFNQEISFFINVSMAVYYEHYNGKKRGFIKKEKWANVLRRHCDHTINMPVTYEDYGDKTGPDEFLYCMFHAYIGDIDYDYFSEFSLRIKQPELSFRVVKNVVENQNSLTDITLYNPVNYMLQKCKFILGEADSSNTIQIERDVILPKEKVKVKFFINPLKRGNYDLVARFVSSAFSTWAMARLTVGEIVSTPDPTGLLDTKLSQSRMTISKTAYSEEELRSET